MTRDEAESLLKDANTNCHMTRFNIFDKVHMLSVSGGEHNIIQHVIIQIDSNDYGFKLNEASVKFDNFSDLLINYQNNPISEEIPGIGPTLSEALQQRQQIPQQPEERGNFRYFLNRIK